MLANAVAVKGQVHPEQQQCAPAAYPFTCTYGMICKDTNQSGLNAEVEILAATNIAL